ncbi:hypothetical protein FRC12_004989 [Ceratobasidium sp. 428]|nr:hypothetical protein FRC12_004989 [Ceratobasidium sp. 428]
MSPHKTRSRTRNEALANISASASPTKKKFKKPDRLKRKKAASEQSVEASFTNGLNRHIQKLAETLTHEIFKHPDVQDCVGNLTKFQKWIQKWSVALARKQAPQLADDIKNVAQFVSSFEEPLSQALKDYPEGERGHESWPYYVHERFRAMVRWSNDLGDESFRNQPSDKGLQSRIQLANTELELDIKAIQALNKWYKRLGTSDRKEEHRLRNELSLLKLTGRLGLENFENLTTNDQVRALLDKHRDITSCRVYDFRHLNKYPNCAECTRLEKDLTIPPIKLKYKAPTDGSGTPWLRKIFPTGGVHPEDMERHNIRWITGGTTCGLANAPDGGDELAFMIHFVDYEKADDAHRYEVERIVKLLWEGKQYGNRCTSNSAQNEVDPKYRGDMFMFGNRKDTQANHAGIPWCRYAIPEQFLEGKAKEKYLKYHESGLSELVVRIHSVYRRCMHSCLSVKKAAEFMATFGVPGVEQSFHRQPSTDSLGGNATLSFNGFSNGVHLDNDQYRFVFSIYVFVDRDTGRLITDPVRIANCMKGGYLYWPDVHVALKIIHASGMVIMIWRGTHERHCTVISEVLDSSIERIGTSIQVNRNLFTEVQKYHQQLDVVLNWEKNGKIGDCPPFPVLPLDIEDMFNEKTERYM